MLHNGGGYSNCGIEPNAGGMEWNWEKKKQLFADLDRLASYRIGNGKEGGGEI